MLSSNLTSAVFAAGLASRYLPPSGTLVLTGASASLSPSSCSDFMPGYGLSKMGVTNLAAMLREEVEFKVVVVHPGTIDTKANRDAMPDANFDEWNSTEGIARGVREVRGMFLFPRWRRHFGNAQRGCSVLSQTHEKPSHSHALIALLPPPKKYIGRKSRAERAGTSLSLPRGGRLGLRRFRDETGVWVWGDCNRGGGSKSKPTNKF